MLEFLAGNLASILVGLLVAAGLCFAVVRLVRDRKKGGCAGCPCAHSCAKGRASAADCGCPRSEP